MNRIDDDLERLLEDEHDVPPAESDRPPPASGRPTASRRNVALLVALAVIAIGIGLLVFYGFQSAAVYAKPVDQLLAARDRFVNRDVRVEGTLVHGSLQRRDYPCEYRFELRRNDQVLAVRYPQCVVPDTFRDRPETDVAVTAEGRLLPDGVFEATRIMAKCPSKYEERGGKLVPVGELK